ncbi:hypothetical protein [Bradyrhizobium sp. JYMT SZCCT0428]|uniref:hypothetical protein n=1 Tax=Bradyrhizobium sp. JYMT SZCCT0428 TaxID=2807673 RepID=UPI001BA7523C|nr:hypothetical protein [Bradyrhizobium sp. JYMT SZCCT0428]MBR1157468.1 hypothetical protein [Bradyrhizobium sp. JYMT SZCCT0428]
MDEMDRRHRGDRAMKYDQLNDEQLSIVTGGTPETGPAETPGTARAPVAATD